MTDDLNNCKIPPTMEILSRVAFESSDLHCFEISVDNTDAFQCRGTRALPGHFNDNSNVIFQNKKSLNSNATRHWISTAHCRYYQSQRYCPTKGASHTAI